MTIESEKEIIASIEAAEEHIKEAKALLLNRNVHVVASKFSLMGALDDVNTAIKLINYVDR